MIARGKQFHDHATGAHSHSPLLNLALRHCGFAAALVAVNLFIVLVGALAGVAYVLGYHPQMSQSIQDQRGLETER